MDKRVIVTGASGFIGRHIASAWQGNNVDVHGLTRSQLADATALYDAVHDADVLVHAAHASSEGTEQLAEIAVRAGVKHFIHMSSVAVLQVGRESVVDDATPVAPTTSYGRRKYQEEITLTGACRTNGMRLTILRCPAVFGPGMTGRPLRLGRWVVSGWPIPDVGGRRSLIYVDNVAAATISAAAVSGTFLIEDGLVASPFEFASLLKQAHAHKRPLRLPVPGFAVRAAGRISGAAVKTFLRDIIVDGSRFARESGYQPPVQLDAALKTTVSWLKATK